MNAMLIRGPGKQELLTDGSTEAIEIRQLEPGLVRLEGARSSLEFVHRCASAILLTQHGAARIAARASVDLGPQITLLAMLRLRVNDEPLHALVLGNHLVLTGMPQSLSLFCNAVQSAALGAPGAESHLRYHEGHARIDRRSLHLVVRRAP